MIYRGPNTAHGRGTPAVDVGNYLIEIWGQSNAIGRADRTDIAASPLTADSGLATYDAGTFSRVFIWNGTAFVNLQPSTNNQCDAGQFGPEFGLAVRWTRETTTGGLYLIKGASSGVSISTFISYLWSYNARRNNADAWLTTNGVSLAGNAWVWIQGESDVASSQVTYKGSLDTLMASRVTNGFDSGGNKKLLMQMAVGSAQYGAGVAAAKDEKATEGPSYISAPDMPLYMKADNLHQNGRGQVQAAYDIFSIVFDKTTITV